MDYYVGDIVGYNDGMNGFNVGWIDEVFVGVVIAHFDGDDVGFKEDDVGFCDGDIVGSIIWIFVLVLVDVVVPDVDGFFVENSVEFFAGALDRFVDGFMVGYVVCDMDKYM